MLNWEKRLCDATREGLQCCNGQDASLPASQRATCRCSLWVVSCPEPAAVGSDLCRQKVRRRDLVPRIGEVARRSTTLAAAARGRVGAWRQVVGAICHLSHLSHLRLVGSILIQVDGQRRRMTRIASGHGKADAR